uniref:D-arabinono-1,4-lactone oxidase C-terminal domain-containing protein n=1 Tax=Sphenodon punctatus TaxID=8508 RepID=A0A8D0H0K0_SPHPU
MLVHGQGGVKFYNWARTYGSSPELYFQPTSVEEIKEILDLARQRSKRVKVLWRKSHPNNYRIRAVSEVAAGGVIGTGTHNTGIKHGILATQVLALTLLTASGEILECSEAVNAELFQANYPAPSFCSFILCFSILQVLDNLDSHLQKSEYFRFLWFPHSENVSVIYQDHTNKPPSTSASWLWDYAIGYYLLEFLLWISTFLPAMAHWLNRFFFWLLFTAKVENVNLSYKIFSYECRFRQHVQDWAIPIEKTKEALLELKGAIESNPKVVAHYPVEVRFARGDNILLSPCFQRESCYMNIIMYSCRFSALVWIYGVVEAHNCTRKDFETMYPGFHKFCSIRENLDPTGMFLNAYLEKVFY